MLNHVDVELNKVHACKPLSQYEVNEPIHINRWFLSYNPLQLFELLCKVLLARCVANELYIFLVCSRWPRHLRVLDYVFKPHLCILVDSPLKLLLNHLLELVVLLVERLLLLLRGHVHMHAWVEITYT